MKVKKFWQSEFQVVRAEFFLEKGKLSPAVGDIITLSDPNIEFDFVSRGLIIPTDLPPVGVYIALMDFELPGRKEKFVAKKLDRVELKKEDALELMLKNVVIPADENQWRPYGRRMKTVRESEPLTAKNKTSFTKNWRW